MELTRLRVRDYESNIMGCFIARILTTQGAQGGPILSR